MDTGFSFYIEIDAVNRETKDLNTKNKRKEEMTAFLIGSDEEMCKILEGFAISIC